MRYNELYRNVNKTNHICIKTFDKYLKELVTTKIIQRVETDKYNVHYKISPEFLRFKQETDNEPNLLIREYSGIQTASDCQLIMAQFCFLESANTSSIKTAMDRLSEDIGTMFKMDFLRATYFLGKDRAISDFVIDEFTHKLNKGLKEILDNISRNQKILHSSAEYADKTTFDLIKEFGHKFFEYMNHIKELKEQPRNPQNNFLYEQ